MRGSQSELVHISRIETMRDLMELREKYHEACETAECRLMPQSVCDEPRPREQCPWGPTKFCGARLRDEAVVGRAMDADWQRRARSEEAEECRIPRSMWDAVGVRTGRPDGTGGSEALRFLVHSSERRLVVIHGQDGTGKSVAAASWCWRKKGWYYRATGLKWWTRGNGWNTNPEDSKLLHHHSVAIVGLDRPWANKDGAHRHNLIHILYQRLDAGKYTLLTSNLGLTDVEALVGSSLFRSLRKWNAIGTITEQVDKDDRREQTETTF